VRSFWRGDRPLLGAFAERFAGSSDLFRHDGRKPTASVNYVAAHDGFTLADSVTYNHRRNEANLEHNRDGHEHNLSWNCGVEGPTDEPAVLGLRARQMRNLLATVFLSQGVPMLLAGDEFGRTQQGNNNAYCQDNEVSWVDWSLLERNSALAEFVHRLIDLRHSRLWLRRDTFLKGSQRAATTRDVAWLHPSGREMTEADWNDTGLRSLAILMNAGVSGAKKATGGDDLLIAFNADDAPTAMTLPTTPHGQAWAVVFDTVDDVQPAAERILRCSEVLEIGPRSTVLLESRAA
jgi:glycogen operon protein